MMEFKYITFNLVIGNGENVKSAIVINGDRACLATGRSILNFVIVFQYLPQNTEANFELSAQTRKLIQKKQRNKLLKP